MPNRSAMITNSIAGLKKGYSIRMSRYFLPHPYERSGRNGKFELDLSIYETKADMKETTGIDTSKWTSKTDLASLKTKKDDRNIDKVNNVPADLSNLSNVVDNDVVKKTVYGQLLIKVDPVGAKIPRTSRLVAETQHDLDKQGLERRIDNVDKKITNTSGMVNKT